MMRIFVEDQELDVYQDFTQQVTYAIDDLINLDSKATNFTKTIVVPSSTKNNLIFGNIFEFGNSNFYTGGANVFYNFNASVSAKARIEVNGLSIMKGVLRLLKIIHDKDTVEYEVALFGELGGLFSAIGNKKLEDIDFSKYNHNWNITNILESWEPAPVVNFVGTYSFQSLGKTLTLNLQRITTLKAGDTIEITGTSSNNRTYGIGSISTNVVGTIITLIGTVTTESGSDLTITKKSLNVSLGIGFTYPLINYGNVTYNLPTSSQTPTYYKYKDWQFKAFRPAVYVREYMNRIITDAGYTWESQFFNTNFFKRLIVPNNDQNLQRAGENYLVDASGLTNTTSYTLNYGTGNTILTSFTRTTPIRWTNLTLIDFTYNFPVTAGAYIYTPDNSRPVIITLIYNAYIEVTGASNLSRLTSSLLIWINGSVVQRYNLQNSTISGNRIYYSTKVEYEFQVNKNDEIRFQHEFQDPQYNGIVTYNIVNQDNQLSIEPNPKTFVDYLYNQTLNFNNVIPRNIQQRDFFASIIKMFNLMIVEDRYQDKHLKIEPDVTFYLTDRTTYIDWSEKVDRSQAITITPMSEANARYYEFKYKDDNDYRNEQYKKKFGETYGNRIFDNQLEFAKDTQKVEVIFSSSILESVPNEDKVWCSIYKDNNGVEDRISHNIRIMQCKLIKDVEPYKILNDETVLTDASGITKYMYAGHFNDPDFPTSDLNWGAVRELQYSLQSGSLQNNLFNGFYSSYMAEITDKDSRLVTCTMKLTDVDVFNIDWRKYVYIDGILYRLKKIIDWSDDNTCKVELLRVINTTYLNEAITFDTTGIDEQIWSSDNLNTLYYNNGDAIPLAKDDNEWQNFNATNKGCCAYFKYDDGSTYGDYGLFYNAWALKDSRGVCPAGWRLPTRTDFETLDVATDGNALKQTGIVTWNTGNTGTNATSFNALGIGYIDGSDGSLRDEGEAARFWTSTAYDSDETYYMLLGKTTALIKTDSFARNYDGYNVRLIKI